MRKAFALMGPVMISTWVQPINLTINTKFGSRLYEGAGVSAMEYSTNLYLVIAGVFILSITNVIFPRLSRLTAEHQEGAFRDTLRQTVHGSLFFVLPMAAGLMVLARPMVSFLYGGGEFDAFSVSITSEALVWVSLGMVGYGLQNILSRAYFARQDGRTPLVAGGVSILANILLCMVLTEPMGVAGLAIASTVSSTLYAVLLLVPMELRGGGSSPAALGRTFENAGVHGGDGGGGLAGPEQPVRPSARGQSGGAASAGGLRGAGGGGLFPAGRPDASGGDGAGPGSDETNLETRLRYGTNANDRAGQRRVPGAGGPVPVVRRAVEGSGLIQWFIHPPLQLEQAESDHSVFARLWRWIHGGLCRLYRALRLDRLFEGSIFQKCWLWAGAAAVLAPIIPTMAVLGLVLVSAFSLLLNLMADSGRKLYYAPMNRYLWLYAAIYLAGTWFSVTRAGSLLGGVLTVAFILFAVILENSITTRRQLDTLLLLLVMAGTAVALYGICQYLFGWGYQSAAWADSEMFGDVFRVPSTLENPNMLGQYLILAIPLGGAGLLAAKDWGMRVFYFCCCGIMCVCMSAHPVPGAWLGLLFAGFVFVLFLQPRSLLLTPLLLVVLYFVLPDAVINRFASIGNLGDSSTSYRVYIWMGTLAMLKDYWMCGIGPGDAAFNLVYPKYSYSGIVAPHAHNLFLQIVCDAGVVALVVFVLLLFHYFRDLCAAFCREKDLFSRLYQTAAVSGIAGFLVQAMTDYSFYNYRVLLLFWAWLALGALLARRGQLPERGLKV
ncbi:MAG: lipid II flippase MurJ [Lawsonibacter sp.]